MHPSQANQYWIKISTVVILFLAGCQPPPLKKNSDAPAAKFSALTEKQAACEEALRAQMKAKTLLFKDVPDYSKEIEEANEILKSQTNKTFYVANESKKQIQSLEFVNELVKENEDLYFSYEIAKASGDTAAKLLLDLFAERTIEGKDLRYYQSFLVDADCKMKVSQTSFTQLNKQGSEKIRYSNLDIYSDGGKSPKTIEFSLPENGVLKELMISNKPLDPELKKKVYSYAPGKGLMYTESKNLEPSTEKAFGLELTFKNQLFTTKMNDTVIRNNISSSDEKNRIYKFTKGAANRWTVPENIWDSLSLGSTEDLNLYIQSELPEKYLSTNDSIIVLADHKFSYPNISGYWKIDRSDEIEKIGKTLMLLKENPEATFKDTATSLDLASNSTIQTEIPEVKKIALAISTKTEKRSEQIQEILNYLEKNYTYDMDMLKNNVIRSLSTTEALEHKKGVCQHYAVVFTSIARALKIPTRIVSGYSLSSKVPVLHAWNEVEIEEGTWKVIEPQDPQSLKEMHTRFFLPRSRALHLENKDADGFDEKSDFYNQTVLKPGK